MKVDYFKVYPWNKRRGAWIVRGNDGGSSGTVQSSKTGAQQYADACNEDLERRIREGDRELEDYLRQNRKNLNLGGAHQLGVPKFRTPLTMRLERELKELEALKKDSTILEVKAHGDPPDTYQVIFHGKSLVPADNEDGVAVGRVQECEITLGREFPRRRPEVKWLSPIIHPNISGGSVCMGNFAANWNPNFTLSMLVEVLWDMARMAIFNPHSAYGRDTKLTWEQLDKKFHFPVDRRPLRDKLLPNDAGSSIVRPDGGEADIVIMGDDTEGCTFVD